MENVEFTQCATHGSFSHRWQETVYNMFHFTTLYVVPLLVMSCCYSRILLHIHLQHLREKGKTHLTHLQSPDHTDTVTSRALLSQQGSRTCVAVALTSSQRLG